jgi:hypothetical protein
MVLKIKLGDIGFIKLFKNLILNSLKVKGRNLIMAYIFGPCNGQEVEVQGIVYVESSISNEEKVRGYQVELIPNSPEPPEDQEVSKTFYNLDTKTYRYEFGDKIPTDQDRIVNLEYENMSLKQQLGLLPPLMEPITLDDYKANKKYELSKACEAEILAGFYSAARGTREWFTNSERDQAYIKNQYDLARDFPGVYIPQWKSAAETVCTDFTFEQIRQLVLDGAAFLVERRHTYDVSSDQIDAITDSAGMQAAIEAVQAISWTNKVWS